MWLMCLCSPGGSRYTLWISRLGLQAETLEGLEMTKTKKNVYTVAAEATMVS